MIWRELDLWRNEFANHLKVFQHEFSNLSLPFEDRFYKLRLFWLSRVCHTLPSVCDTVTRVCDSNGGVCDIVTRVRFVTHSREFATWRRRSQAPFTLRLRIFWKRIKRFPSTLRRKHLTTRQIHRQCILDLCPRKNWTGIITWLLWHHHCRKTTFSKCFRPVLKLITQQERYHFDLIPLIVL